MRALNDDVGRTNTSGGPHDDAGRVFETPDLDVIVNSQNLE